MKYLLLVYIIEESISSKNNNIVFLYWVFEFKALLRRIPLAAYLIRKVESALLFLTFEYKNSFVLVVFAHYHITRVSNVRGLNQWFVL